MIWKVTSCGLVHALRAQPMEPLQKLMSISCSEFLECVSSRMHNDAHGDVVCHRGHSYSGGRRHSDRISFKREDLCKAGKKEEIFAVWSIFSFVWLSKFANNCRSLDFGSFPVRTNNVFSWKPISHQIFEKWVWQLDDLVKCLLKVNVFFRVANISMLYTCISIFYNRITEQRSSYNLSFKK